MGRIDFHFHAKLAAKHNQSKMSRRIFRAENYIEIEASAPIVMQSIKTRKIFKTSSFARRSRSTFWYRALVFAIVWKRESFQSAIIGVRLKQMMMHDPLFCFICELRFLITNVRLCESTIYALEIAKHLSLVI
jgi:hypothetical protein